MKKGKENVFFFFKKKNGFREVSTTGIIMRIIYATIRDKPTTFTGFMVHDSIISKQYSSKVKKHFFSTRTRINNLLSHYKGDEIDQD